MQGIDYGFKNELGNEILKIKDPHFIYNDAFEFSEFNKKFDYIIAQSIFSHASKAQIEKCFEQAENVMKPDSLFLATFILAKKDYEGTDWVYPGCVEYSLKYVKHIAQKFNLIARKIFWYHPAQSWFLFFNSKYKAELEIKLRTIRKLYLRNAFKPQHLFGRF